MRTAPSPSTLRMKARKTFSPPRDTRTVAPSIGRPSSSITRPASVAPRVRGTSCVSAWPGGDGHRAGPRHEALVLGRHPVGLGGQPAHRVPPVRAGAREELPARGPGHDPDARERPGVRAVHHPPGERRGRGEGDRDGLLCSRGQDDGGPAAVSPVGHERSRLARRAVEQEGAVRARLDPAGRLRAPLEAHEGARHRGTPVGEGDRAPQDLTQRERHGPRERAGPDRLPLLRGEGRRLDADAVALLGGGLETERPVGLRHRRLRHGGGGGDVLRPPAAHPATGSRSRRRPVLPSRPRRAPRGREPSAGARPRRPPRPSRTAGRAPAAPPALPRTRAGRPHPPFPAPRRRTCRRDASSPRRAASGGPRAGPPSARRRSRPRTAGRPRRHRRPACRPRRPGRGSRRRGRRSATGARATGQRRPKAGA